MDKEKRCALFEELLRIVALTPLDELQYLLTLQDIPEANYQQMMKAIAVAEVRYGRN